MTSLPCLQPPAAILAVGEHIEVLAWRHRLSVEILRSLGLEHFLAPIKAYKLLNTPDCDLHRGHRYAKYLLQFTLLLDSRPLAEIPIEELHILRSDARTALIYRTAVEDLPSLSNKPDVMLSRVEYYVKALMLCTGIIDPQTPSEAYNDARESDSSDSGESAYSSPDPDPTVNTGSAPGTPSIVNTFLMLTRVRSFALPNRHCCCCWSSVSGDKGRSVSFTAGTAWPSFFPI